MRHILSFLFKQRIRSLQETRELIAKDNKALIMAAVIKRVL